MWHVCDPRRCTILINPQHPWVQSSLRWLRSHRAVQKLSMSLNEQTKWVCTPFKDYTQQYIFMLWWAEPRGIRKSSCVCVCFRRKPFRAHSLHPLKIKQWNVHCKLSVILSWNEIGGFWIGGFNVKSWFTFGCSPWQLFFTVRNLLKSKLPTALT